jgi:hypothetical protein
LYTTIGNTTWFQRGAAALAALLLVAAGISLGIWTLPAAQPPAAPAAESPVAPRSTTRSPYDGSAYVEYLTGGAVAPNPNVPAIGTGSAYDGRSYSGAPAAPAANPNVPAIGTGSAYDGRSYSGAPAARAAANPNVPAIGTGSAYDGRSYSGVRPAAQVQPIGLGIDLPAGAVRGEMPSGLTDYIRPSQ